MLLIWIPTDSNTSHIELKKLSQFSIAAKVNETSKANNEVLILPCTVITDVTYLDTY